MSYGRLLAEKTAPNSPGPGVFGGGGTSGVHFATGTWSQPWVVLSARPHLRMAQDLCGINGQKILKILLDNIASFIYTFYTRGNRQAGGQPPENL